VTFILPVTRAHAGTVKRELTYSRVIKLGDMRLSAFRSRDPPIAGHSYDLACLSTKCSKRYIMNNTERLSPASAALVRRRRPASMVLPLGRSASTCTLSTLRGSDLEMSLPVSGPRISGLTAWHLSDSWSEQHGHNSQQYQRIAVTPCRYPEFSRFCPIDFIGFSRSRSFLLISVATALYCSLDYDRLCYVLAT
jgi:hypothetical protein